MAFSANPLSLSVPEPAFESWLRDSGYIEILDERTTHIHRQPPPTATATATTKAAAAAASTSTIPTAATTTANSIVYFFTTLFSLVTINPFSKLTTDDFSSQTPSWTLVFLGSVNSYSFPSSPSQAKLRVHENTKRYARNYATLLLLFFACALYQMPVALFGLIACLGIWELSKWCSQQWGLDQYPLLHQTLSILAYIATLLILYISSVQMALFCATVVSYAVVILHGSLRKLSPLKQTTKANGSKWFQQNKRRS